jgi:hypothetical protein
LGVAASRHHTVCYSALHVYTFGRNQGQLGHPRDEEHQVAPRAVSFLERYAGFKVRVRIF